MLEGAHHYVAPLLLDFRHLLKFVAETRLLDDLLPFGVLLKFFGIERLGGGIAELALDVGTQLHHLRHDFVADFRRDAVGVACAGKLHIHGAHVGGPVGMLAHRCQEIAKTCG